MPRILLLLPTATYRADAFLEAAKKLNIEVIVGCDVPPSLMEQRFRNCLVLDFLDVDAAIRISTEFAKHHPFDAVIGVNDNTTVLAAAISEALGLPHNTVTSVAAARNKYDMRTHLRDHGLQVPQFLRVSIYDNPKNIAETLSYPCVVKPLILSASCGVIRTNDPKSFLEAFARVSNILANLGLDQREEAGRQILIEEFISGPEVALEGLLTKGQLRVLALFDKPDPLDGPFFEETIYVTPSRLPQNLQHQISATLMHAADALGLKEGPVHGEFRINAQGVWVIEIAARSIGGRCSQTLRFSSGWSLEELILRHALRMDLSSLKRRDDSTGVMMLPISQSGILKTVDGQEEARQVAGIEELVITAQPGELLVPLPEGTRYLGFLLARGHHPDEVEHALREAHQCLDITFSPIPHTTVQSGILSV